MQANLGYSRDCLSVPTVLVFHPIKMNSLLFSGRLGVHHSTLQSVVGWFTHTLHPILSFECNATRICVSVLSRVNLRVEHL